MMLLAAHPTPAHSGDPLPGDDDVYLQNDDTLRFKLRDTPELRKFNAAVGYDAAGRLVDATKSATGLTRNEPLTRLASGSATNRFLIALKSTPPADDYLRCALLRAEGWINGR